MKDRKKDHIDLAFKSQLELLTNDKRFDYEPLISAHPDGEVIPQTFFLGKTMKIPVWISSMTGGTKLAEKINVNLAKACNEFGMGMGLGSCRMIVDDDTWLKQFDVRDIIGPELPLYANLGVAQIEKLIAKKSTDKIIHLLEKLRADGLIIHVNPMQEYFQPEGDLLKVPAIETVNQITELIKTKIIVKEVGQGMGPESLGRLLGSSVNGIEFGAYGGANFAKVELMRSDETKQEMFAPFMLVGQTASEMLDFINGSVILNHKIKSKQLIISGGIKTFLDGYYLINKSKFPAVYGQASTFLKYARDDYNTLKSFIEYQVKGLQLAYSFLRIRENDK